MNELTRTTVHGMEEKEFLQGEKNSFVKSCKKKKVYLFEFNLMMGKAIYLPIATSLLKTYALQSEIIKQNYQFMPYIFKKDALDNIIDAIEQPSIAAFSVSMWNYNLSLRVAKEIKQRWPQCLIVMGGPNIPFAAEEFLRVHDYVDVTVRGEGEKTFYEILKINLESFDFSTIPGISYRNQKKSIVRNDAEQNIISDLQMIPSPYLVGEFDYLLQEGNDTNYQVIIETNRGCPFNCGYCFWGMGGLNTKMRLMPLEKIKELAEWIANNKIAYVFCADSNFGMFSRDVEIARYFAEVKTEQGFQKNLGYVLLKTQRSAYFP